MLGWLRRAKPLKKAPSGLRAAALLSPGELELWRTLEGGAPVGHRVLPLVPLAFFVEGDLSQELQGEAVPFLQVDRFGYPYKAYLYEEGPLSRLLSHLGLEWELLSLQSTPVAGGSVSPPAEELPQPRATQSAPEGHKDPLPPPPEEEEEEEERGGAGNRREETTPSPLEELATAFWLGELKPQELPAESPQDASQRKGLAEAPAESPKGETPVLAQPIGESTETPSCPLCGAPMVLRVARRGKSAGHSFWGCSRYPHCKGTRPRN